MKALDAIDRKLIALLQDNARLSTVALAKAVGLSRSTVQERLHRIADEWPDRELVVRGLEDHCAASGHCFAARWRRREVA